MSSESLVSLILPWKQSVSSRKLPVPATETGRVLHPSAFLLCLVSILLLTSGLIFLIVSIWIIINRYHYNKLIHFPIFDLGDLGLFGGFLGVPCFWIACATHENRRNHVFLPFLILLLVLSLTLITTGFTATIINRTRMSFVNENKQGNNQYPKLINGPYQRKLSHNMLFTMESYFDDHNRQFKKAWDDAQSKLQCCGVDGPSDWKKYHHDVPPSCYQHNVLRENGCLDLVVYKLACQMNVVIGLALITFGIQICAIMLASYIYVRSKYHAINNFHNVNKGPPKRKS